MKIVLSLLALLAVLALAYLLLDNRDDEPPADSASSSTSIVAPSTTSTTTVPVELLEPQVVEVQQAPPPEATAPPPAPAPVPRVPALDGDVWFRLAACESSGRWDISDRYHSGGLQFAWSTWASFRPDDYPEFAHEATPQQQIDVARRVLEKQGPGAWPVCGPKVGLRRGM